jgi:hypothetical protein
MTSLFEQHKSNQLGYDDFSGQMQTILKTNSDLMSHFLAKQNNRNHQSTGNSEVDALINKMPPEIMSVALQIQGSGGRSSGDR